MTRSVWKGPFVDACLFKQKKIRWKIWACRFCILPQFVGCYTQIYNGKGSVGLKITEEMVWRVINLENLLLHGNLLPLGRELRPQKQKIRQKKRYDSDLWRKI